MFVGKTIKQVAFNTTRGGVVPGDDFYRMYDVIWQAPPDNLAAEGFPTTVCNQGPGPLGGGELYNRSASVSWPEDSVLDGSGGWSNPRDAVVHMMHNGWGNVQYTVASMHASNRTITFERGGYQHGRSGAVGPFFIENQLELLDAPGEWYSNGTTLFLWPNETNTSDQSSPPPLSAAVLASIVVINGTQLNPVTHVSFEGIGFSRTAPTYLEPHERPISGVSKCMHE